MLIFWEKSVKLIVAVVAFWLSIASVGYGEQTKQTLMSLENLEVPLADLLTHLDNLNDHVHDTGLEMILSPETTDDDRLLIERAECGRKTEFETYYALSGLGNYKPSHDELDLLVKCMKVIYSFLDDHFGAAAPGFAMAYSKPYLNHAADVAYRCGYRSEYSFRLFSLATWFYGVEEVQKLSSFACIEEPQEGLQGYAPESLNFTLRLTVEKALFLFRVLEDWKYFRLYTVYEQTVNENRELVVCKEILSSQDLMTLFAHDTETLTRCYGLSIGGQ